MGARILVVDDTAAMRAQIREVLENSDLELTIVEAEDGAQALPIALSGEIDVVVSDIVMPNLDGIALLRAIRQQRDIESLPVILVTSQREQETRTVSFDVGANDYLTRPYSSAELLARIKVQLRLRSLHEELQRANERHRELVVLDELTGLANRRHFLELCRRELARCRRHKIAMSVCVFDIDHLREINSRSGTRAGDALISEVADVLRTQLRGPDTLARFTGGKFAVLMPNTEARGAQHIGERVCDVIAAKSFPGQRVGEVSVSIGTSSYPCGNLESVEEILNAAQATLDRAKESGRNRVESWFDESQPAEPDGPTPASGAAQPEGQTFTLGSEPGKDRGES